MRRGNVLCFDVDLNDLSLFFYCFEDKKEDDELFKIILLFLLNFRLSILKLKLLVSCVVDSEEGKIVSKVEVLKIEVVF